MPLAFDAHVHSEWSWDTGGRTHALGRMERTCERAVRIGLPGLAFTEHLDLDDRWRSSADDLLPHQRQLLDDDDYVRTPLLDVEGYLDGIARCRHRFPELRILTGLEFGQPHLHEDEAARLLDLSLFDRINGSLHTLEIDGDRSEPNTLFRRWPADRVMTRYLEELPRLAAEARRIQAVTHLDYAVRSWPVDERGPFDPRRFEDPIRAAMRAVADAGFALEMNTRRLWSWLPQWWVEEGGRAVSLGSDAHVPEDLAAHFPEAAAMLQHYGFHPGTRVEDFWRR